MKFCTKCGNQISDDNYFCDKCGNRVEQQTDKQLHPVVKKIMIKSIELFI